MPGAQVWLLFPLGLIFPQMTAIWSTEFGVGVELPLTPLESQRFGTVGAGRAAKGSGTAVWPVAGIGVSTPPPLVLYPPTTFTTAAFTMPPPPTVIALPWSESTYTPQLEWTSAVPTVFSEALSCGES